MQCMQLGATPRTRQDKTALGDLAIHSDGAMTPGILAATVAPGQNDEAERQCYSDQSYVI